MKHNSRRTDSLHNSRQRRKAESTFTVPSKQGFFPPHGETSAALVLLLSCSNTCSVTRGGDLPPAPVPPPPSELLSLRLRSALARPRCVGECKYAAVVSSHWPVTPLCGRVGEGARCLYKSTVPSSVSVTQRGLTVKLPQTVLERKGRWSLSPLA